MIPIQKILDEVVERIKDKGQIISIENIGTNKYKITTDFLDLTFENDLINIKTSSINKDFKVIEVGINFFIIQSSEIIQNEIGVFSNHMPIFEYEYFDYEARNLTNKNQTLEKFKKFPLIFLNFNFKENRTKEFRTSNLQIFIFDKTKEAYLMKDRDLKTFPKLRKIFNKFIKSLKESKYTHVIGDYSYQELPYRNNNLNSIVDAIELNFNNIKFLNCNN